jgi:transposase-like protein
LHIFFVLKNLGKYNREKREDVWVFGGVERRTGNCFLVVVPNRSASTLLAVIKEWIKPGTIIFFGLLEGLR